MLKILFKNQNPARGRKLYIIDDLNGNIVVQFKNQNPARGRKQLLIRSDDIHVRV